jgi:quercetin dioxygenase-like cupin family protein
MPATVTSEVIHLGQTQVQFIATAEQTRGALSIFTAAVAPGAKAPPAHFHDVEEVVYGLEGVLTFYVDGVRMELQPGESLLITANVEHRFANESDAPAKVLTVQTPGTIGPDFYRESAALLGAGGPPDPARMVAIMTKHGLMAVPPKA